MQENVILGIDIGGTYTKFGFVTKNGEILTASRFNTGAKMPFPLFMDQLETGINTLKAALDPKYAPVAIGVGAPNANAQTGQMEHAPNFNWGTEVPLAKSIESRLALPVSLANDANAAALGELVFGIGKGMKNFVVLTLGTGLGSGIIVNGHLLTGSHGVAGELGHVNVVPNGRQCNCGLRGCLETYVSVTGMKRTVFELMATMAQDSPLRKISFEEMTGVDISNAAIDNDAVALKAFGQTAEFLGCQLADTAAHLDPEAFILLGGLSKAGDILLLPTIASMEKNLFSAYKGKIKVLLSDSPGEHAVIGAAAVAL